MGEAYLVNKLANSRMGNEIKDLSSRTKRFSGNQECVNDSSDQYRNNLVMARANDHRKGTMRESAESVKKAIAGQKWRAPIEAMKLAHSLRQRVKEGEQSPFLVALVGAIIIDLADSTWVIGLCLKLPMFVFLWGKGTFKVKVITRMLLLFDCIPFVSWLPLTTICVLYAWHRTRKEIEENKKKIKEIDKKLRKDGVKDKKHKK